MFGRPGAKTRIRARAALGALFLAVPMLLLAAGASDAATATPYLYRTAPGTGYCRAKGVYKVSGPTSTDRNKWNSGWQYSETHEGGIFVTVVYYENAVTSYNKYAHCTHDSDYYLQKVDYFGLNPATYVHRHRYQTYVCDEGGGGCTPPVTVTTGWSSGTVFS